MWFITNRILIGGVKSATVSYLLNYYMGIFNINLTMYIFIFLL